MDLIHIYGVKNRVNGKSIVDISPEGLRNSVFKNGVGIVFITKEIFNVKKLINKLNKISKRVEYYN